jgi:hypothetical protein
MTPGRVAAAMVMLGWIFLALAFLTSCVSIPVPPFGDRVGELGKLDVKVDVRYVPASTAAPTTAAQDFAWNEFLNSRTIRDK